MKDTSKTKCHAPVFKGSKRNSITVSAYCPNCDEILKEYRQGNCSNCGFEIYWFQKGPK